MLAFDIPTIWPSMKTQDDEPTKPGARKEALARPFLTGLIDDPTLVIDMINFLHSTRRTGVLTVIDGEARKSLFFAQGSLIAGASNLPEDRFGNVMVRMGLISLDVLEHALKDVGPQRRIGNVLLSRGLLSTKDLWRIVRVQIEEILFSILLLEKGEFNVAHYDPGQVPSRTALNTQHVLLEGLRRKDEMEHLRGAMPPRDRLLVRTRRERNLTLNPNERRVYDLVDGVRQVGEVYRESGLGELEATRLIHHLLKIGLITEATHVEVVPGEAGGGGTSVGAIVTAFNEAILLINEALVADGDRGLIAHGVDSFFDDIDPDLAALFEEIMPAPDGRIPPDRIYANLKLAPTKDKLMLLRRGLSDYVQFILFLAREALDFDRVERLAWQVKSQLRGFDI